MDRNQDSFQTLRRAHQVLFRYLSLSSRNLGIIYYSKTLEECDSEKGLGYENFSEASDPWEELCTLIRVWFGHDPLGRLLARNFIHVLRFVCSRDTVNFPVYDQLRLLSWLRVWSSRGLIAYHHQEPWRGSKFLSLEIMRLWILISCASYLADVISKAVQNRSALRILAKGFLSPNLVTVLCNEDKAALKISGSDVVIVVASVLIGGGVTSDEVWGIRAHSSTLDFSDQNFGWLVAEEFTSCAQEFGPQETHEPPVRIQFLHLDSRDDCGLIGNP
ncbi:hypothetical protein Tco_0762106 [Tanacetum coccineum]